MPFFPFSNTSYPTMNTFSNLYNRNYVISTLNDTSSTVYTLKVGGKVIVSHELTEDDVIFANPTPMLLMVGLNFGIANWPSSGNYWESWLTNIAYDEENNVWNCTLPSGVAIIYPHNREITAIMNPSNGVTNPEHLDWPQYPDINVTSNASISLDNPYSSNVTLL